MDTQKAKIVINKGSAPFQLSWKALDFLGLTSHVDALMKFNGAGRMNPGLIACVEAMGSAASSGGAHLVVKKIMVNTPFIIEVSPENLNGERVYYDHDFHWFVAQFAQPKS